MKGSIKILTSLAVLILVPLIGASYNASAQVYEHWVRIYNGPFCDWDIPTDIAIDADGNVVVTGSCDMENQGLGLSDYATVKYNSSGAELWVATYNSPENNNDLATSLAIDAEGNVYVTGQCEQNGFCMDFVTIKYNSAGEERWVARYNGVGNGYDRAEDIAVDEDGNVYVTGYSLGSGTEYDYTTIKYDSAGVEQWVARYNGSTNEDDLAYAIAVDIQGGVRTASPPLSITPTVYNNGREYLTMVLLVEGMQLLWIRMGMCT
jgi:hypothetical protein